MKRCGTREQDLVVLEAARLRLVGVDDEVVRVRDLLGFADEAPLAAGREERAAAAAQLRGEQLVGHRRRRQRARLARAPRSRRRPRTRRASSGRARRRRPSRSQPAHGSSSTIAGTSLRLDVHGGSGGRPRRSSPSRSRRGTRSSAASPCRRRSSRRRGSRARPRTPRAPAARRRARTRRSCRPRPCARRPARGGTGRRTTRPTWQYAGVSVERVGDLAERVGREPAVLAPARAAAPAARPSACPPGTSRASSWIASYSALSSPVDLAHHGVERADDRDHVGDQRVGHARRRRLAARRTTGRGTSRATASGRRRSTT